MAFKVNNSTYSKNKEYYFTGIAQQTATVNNNSIMREIPQVQTSKWGMPYHWNTQSNSMRNVSTYHSSSTTAMGLKWNFGWNSAFETAGATSAYYKQSNDAFALQNSGTEYANSNMVSLDFGRGIGTSNPYFMAGHHAPASNEQNVFNWGQGTLGTDGYNELSSDTAEEMNFVANRLQRNHIPMLGFSPTTNQLLAGPQITAASTTSTTAKGEIDEATIMSQYTLIESPGGLNHTDGPTTHGWMDMFLTSYDSSTVENYRSSQALVWELYNYNLAFMIVEYTFSNGTYNFFVLTRLKTGGVPIGIKYNSATGSISGRFRYNNDNGTTITTIDADWEVIVTQSRPDRSVNPNNNDEYYVVKNTEWQLLAIVDDDSLSSAQGFSSFVSTQSTMWINCDGIHELNYYTVGTPSDGNLRWTDSNIGGRAIASKGGRTIIGGHRFTKSGDTDDHRGAVAVFDSNNLGQPENELNHFEGNVEGGHFGVNVAVCGQWAAIAAPEDGPSGSTGKVYLRNIYNQYSGNGVTAKEAQKSYFAPSQASGNYTQDPHNGIVPLISDQGTLNTGNQGGWGAAGLAFNYGKLAIGHIYANAEGQSNSVYNGAVALYDVDDETGRVSNEKRLFLNDVAKYEDYDITNNEFPGDERFGSSIAIGCGRMVITAPSMKYLHRDDDGNYNTSTRTYSYGAAFLYDLEGGFIKRLHVPESVMFPNGVPSNFQKFGSSVSIGSGLIAVANYQCQRNTENKTSGNVFIFDLNGNYMFDLRSKWEDTIRARDGYNYYSNQSTWVHKSDNSLSMQTGSSGSTAPSLGNENWTGQLFGYDVDIAFGKIVVGFPGFCPNGAYKFVGAVLVFDLNGKLVSSYIPEHTDHEIQNGIIYLFGADVCSSYGKILIGAPETKGGLIQPPGAPSAIPWSVWVSHPTMPINKNFNGSNDYEQFGQFPNDSNYSQQKGSFFSVESDPVMTPWDLLELENGWR
jgi:hypothetical protein